MQTCFVPANFSPYVEVNFVCCCNSLIIIIENTDSKHAMEVVQVGLIVSQFLLKNTITLNDLYVQYAFTHTCLNLHTVPVVV